MMLQLFTRTIKTIESLKALLKNLQTKIYRLAMEALTWFPLMKSEMDQVPLSIIPMRHSDQKPKKCATLMIKNDQK